VSALRYVVNPRAAGPAAGGGARALAWQSMLIAFVCVAVDGIGGLMSSPPLPEAVWLGLVALVVLADAGLALPARLSGWVALAHAVVLVTVGVALRTAIMLHGTGGHPVEIMESQVGLLIAAYRAGAWLRRWPSLLSLAVLVAGVAGCRFVTHDPHPLPTALDAAKTAVLPWLVGRYTTARRAYIDELRHRGENERRDARAAVEKAVARERTSIARDLHDVISHHVSAIGMHAGAARLALTARAGRKNGVDPVAGSLSAVEAASRAAMVDLRKMLDVLHGNADGAAQPGLANLDELVRAGPPVRLTVHGGPRDLPGSLDVALYRMAQEMLTNACRHGDGSTVDLEVRYRDGAVTLAARNAIGPSRAGSALPRTGGAAVATLPGTGRGLAGIMTRAAMFDGTVSCGPDGAGRWETRVTVSTVEEQ
jgi:signal transduction histidine kinase